MAAEYIHYLYEIKNKINDKIYIGAHSTLDIDDGYMGSGKAITAAIEKHGRDNFTKTIIEYFDSRENLLEKEKNIVNSDFVVRRDTYNLTIGGQGIKSSWKNSNENMKEKFQNDPNWVKNRSENISKGLKHAMQNGKCKTATREFQIVRNQKSNTPEAIEKRKKTYAKIKHQQGKNHCLYGRKAIHNGYGWKWINKEDLDSHLNKGWALGKNQLNRLGDT